MMTALFTSADFRRDAKCQAQFEIEKSGHVKSSEWSQCQRRARTGQSLPIPGFARRHLAPGTNSGRWQMAAGELQRPRVFCAANEHIICLFGRDMDVWVKFCGGGVNYLPSGFSGWMGMESKGDRQEERE